MATLGMVLGIFLLICAIASAPIRIASYVLSTPQQGWIRSFSYLVCGAGILIAAFKTVPFLQSNLLIKNCISFAVFYILASTIFQTNGKHTAIIAAVATLLYQVQYVVHGNVAVN